MSNLEQRCVTTVSAPRDDETTAQWLSEQMNADYPFLLAHADDGVIWGKWADDRLQLAHEVAMDTQSGGISPELRGVTLQQAFVFGPASEVRLFRDELGVWQARKIIDPDKDDIIPEVQMLRGDKVKGILPHDFTHVYDRTQQGLDQILPVRITDLDFDQGRFPRLRVHHLLDYDGFSGEARIALSRLVNIELLTDEEAAQ